MLGTEGIDYLIGTGQSEIINGLGGPIDQVRGGGGTNESGVPDNEGGRDVLRILHFDAAEGDALDTEGVDYTSRDIAGSTYLMLDGDDLDLVVLVSVNSSDVGLA